YAFGGAIWIAGAQVLPCDRCRSAEQARRGPRDQREELRVIDREGSLCGGTVLERSDEPQKEDAADVHRDSLDTGRKSELEQRLDDRPIRPVVHAALKVDH